MPPSPNIHSIFIQMLCFPAHLHYPPQLIAFKTSLSGLYVPSYVLKTPVYTLNQSAPSFPLPLPHFHLLLQSVIYVLHHFSNFILLSFNTLSAAPHPLSLPRLVPLIAIGCNTPINKTQKSNLPLFSHPYDTTSTHTHADHTKCTKSYKTCIYQK